MMGIRYFKVNEVALNEMFDLLERGYHIAYTSDEGAYLTMLITNDDGQMKDGEMDDRIFDLEYAKEEE
jgi:hypothetical protein